MSKKECALQANLPQVSLIYQEANGQAVTNLRLSQVALREIKEPSLKIYSHVKVTQLVHGTEILHSMILLIFPMVNSKITNKNSEFYELITYYQKIANPF